MDITEEQPYPNGTAILLNPAAVAGGLVAVPSLLTLFDFCQQGF